MKKDITIKDIAKKANVSVATVSRVINNSGYVSKHSKEKVLKVIKDLNYQPNIIAKQLKTKISSFVGLIIDKIENPFTSVLVSAIEEQIKFYNLNLILIDNYGELSNFTKIIDLFKQIKVSGIILHLPYFSIREKNLLSNLNIPYVLVSVPTKFPSVSCSCIDNYDVGKKAATVFKKKGYKNIGIIGGKLIDFVENDSSIRLKGFVENFGIKNFDEWKKSNYYETSFKYEEGILGARFLLENNKSSQNKIDGIFCFSDLLAIGAINYLLSKGIKVKEDIGVLGVDDLYIARIMEHYKLSTIKQPLKKIGKTAVDILADKLGLIKNEKIVCHSKLFESVYIERDTL